MTYQIAIDGPAGAGKSTIARKVAKELSFIYVDTGAMYRAVALAFLRGKVDVENEAQVERTLAEITVSIAYQDGEQQVLLNGANVSGLIRTEEVGNMASKAAALPAVREKLLQLQKDLADAYDVVMDGRDIGTNILPNAQLKIYLTASADTRAKRRYLELKEKGKEESLEKIKADILKRDDQDMHRAAAPLCRAKDAVYLDSSELSADEVAKKIKTLTKQS